MAKGTEVNFDQAKQISIIVAVAIVGLNLAFYFLSKMYFEDRAATYGMASPLVIKGTRMAFAFMTGAVGVATIISQFAPRLVAHGLAAAVGLMAILGAVGAGAKNYHVVLPIALGLLGALILVLIYFSLATKSRAAWSFLVSTCAVGALITLFGATKIRNATDVSLYYALILPGILVVATVMLINIADDYAEPTET
jgi:cytochrome c oxidase subunit IV